MVVIPYQLNSSSFTSLVCGGDTPRLAGNVPQTSYQSTDPVSTAYYVQSSVGGYSSCVATWGTSPNTALVTVFDFTTNIKVLDSTAGTWATSSTSPAAGSFTTTNPFDFVVSTFAASNSPGTVTVPSGYTAAGSFFVGETAYIISSPAGSQNPLWSITSSRNWAAWSGAFAAGTAQALPTQPTFGQSNPSNCNPSAVSSFACSMTSNFTSSRAVYVAVGIQVGGSVSSIVGSGGTTCGTFTQLGTFNTNFHLELWSGTGCSGGNQLTVTFGGSSTGVINIASFDNAGLTLDGSIATSSGSASVVPTAVVNGTSNASVVLCFARIAGTGPSGAKPFTLLSATAMPESYTIPGSAGAFSTAWNSAGSGNYATMCAVLKP